MKLKANDIIKIRWDDHCSFDGKWVTTPDHHMVCMVESVGWVVLDGPKHITIALNKQIDDQTYGCLMTVIKSCIVKITKLS